MSEYNLPWEQIDAPMGFAIADEIISKEHCDQVIEWLESRGEFNASKIGTLKYQEKSEMRSSTTAFFPFYDYLLPDFIQEMNKQVFLGLDAYAKEVRAPMNMVEHVSVQRYEVGQEYKIHSDSGGNEGRTFSALLYLNKPEGGGETFFPYQDTQVIPEPGRLVIFPANFMYPHAALPVTKGVKYAAAFWVRAHPYEG